MKRILFLFLLLLLTPWALAAEADSGGYIFRLRDGCTLYSAPAGVQALSGGGFYRADSLADIHQFASPDDLLYIEPDFPVTLFDGDPRYPEQWATAMVGAETAWQLGLDGAGVRIGLIDSGVNASHEDLQGANLLPGWNFAEQNDDTTDTVGHGTFVTGVIAAVHNNDKGIRGIAPAAEIVPLKCFTGKTGKVSYVVDALLAGVSQYGCQIINLSLGAQQSSQALADAVAFAEEQGVILIAAVGNSGTSALNYPAAYDTVIGVGMVDQTKTVASKSQRNSSVLVTAPGADLLGLALDSGCRTSSGTSYAAPHVAAAAALLRQACPSLSPAQLRGLLAQTAIDLGEPGYDTSYGYGLLSLPALLHSLPFCFLPQSGDVNGGSQDGDLQIEGAFIFDRPVAVFAASYQASGRLLRCDALTVTDGPLRLASGVVPLSASTAEVKLFFLDPVSLAPVLPPAGWTP